MTANDIVSIIGAIAGAVGVILAAIGLLWQTVHEYRREVNGRIDQLLELARLSSRAEGRLDVSPPTSSEPPPVDPT